MKDQTTASNLTETEKTKSEISFEWAEKRVLLSLGLFCAILLGIYFINSNSNFFKNLGFGGNSDFGAFGDFVGGALNPILGFATVLLLIKSIHFQIEELRFTRKELAKTSSSNEKIAEFQERNLNLQQGVFLAPLLEKRLALEIIKMKKSCEVGFTQNPPQIYNNIQMMPRTLDKLLNSKASYAKLICAMPDSKELSEFKEELNIAAKELLEKIRECYKIILMMQRYRLPGILYDIDLNHLDSTISNLAALMCETIISPITKRTLVEVSGTLNAVISHGIFLDAKLRAEVEKQ
jgi:hypothetical protein